MTFFLWRNRLKHLTFRQADFKIYAVEPPVRDSPGAFLPEFDKPFTTHVGDALPWIAQRVHTPTISR
jgi:hypothetical protein